MPARKRRLTTYAVGVAGSREPLTRTVHVTALNQTGGFLSDLVSSDLAVEESGGARTIVGVARATEPVSIALLTEGALVRTIQVGTALGAFVRRMPERSVFALYDLDGNRRTEDSADKGAVERALPRRRRERSAAREVLHAPRHRESPGANALVHLVIRVARLERDR